MEPEMNDAPYEGESWKRRIFLASLFLFGYFVAPGRDTNVFYFQDAVQKMYTNAADRAGTDVADLNTLDDAFVYLNETFFEATYFRETPRNYKTNIGPLKNVRLIGHPRLRFIRVRERTERCWSSSKCYGWFTEDNEDTSDYGQGVEKFIWQSAETLRSAGDSGKVSSYGGGGYAVQFPIRGLKQARRLLEKVKKSVDSSVRAIIVDVGMKHIHLERFESIKLLIEVLPVGGIIGQVSFNLIDLERHDGGGGLAFGIVDFVFAILVLTHVVVFAKDLWKDGVRETVLTITGFLDLSIVIACLLYHVTLTILLVKNARRMDALYHELESSDAVDEVLSAFGWHQIVASFVMFFLPLRMIPLFPPNKTLYNLAITFVRCVQEAFALLIYFIFIFTGYVLLGHFLFGEHLEGYSTLPRTVLSLLQLMYGDFNYKDFEEFAPTLGPLYFISFSFILIFIVTNVFLAIVSNTYMEIILEAKEKNSTPLMDWVRDKALGSFGRPMFKYGHFKRDLMRFGHEESTIEEAFRKVGVTVHHDAAHETMKKIVASLTDEPDAWMAHYRPDFYERTDARLTILEKKALDLRIGIERFIDRIQQVLDRYN